jgi:CRISPR-associated protein Cmr6
MTQPAVIRSVAEAANEFADAAPGHRFNLYFPIWRDDWSPDNNRKKDAINACTCIKAPVIELLDGLRARQQTLFAAFPEGLRLAAVSSAPFATGLGNEHPVENGFAFLTPYGLPYLAGSGVKGVLRRAAEELALFPEDFATGNTPAPTLLDVWWLFGFEGVAGAWWPLSGDLPDEAKAGRERLRKRFLAHLGTLAGRPDLPDFICRVIPSIKDRARYRDDPSQFFDELDDRRGDLHSRGALTFWDVFPRPPSQGHFKDKLAVEIMTPHYSDYYQHGGTPNDAGQPTPIPFLAIPPESQFDFHVVCATPELPEALRPAWRPLLESIFAHAFDWLGFGAKTAVGYGAMARDLKAEEQARKDQEAREAEQRAAEEAKRRAEARVAELERLDPVERAIVQFLEQRTDKSAPELSAVIGAVKQGRWQGGDKVVVARWLEKMMRASKGAWKESSQAKKPDKDRKYQNTLLVKGWLAGQ